MKRTKTLKQLIMSSIPAAYDRGDITEIEYKELEEFAQELNNSGIYKIGDIENMRLELICLEEHYDTL